MRWAADTDGLAAVPSIPPANSMAAFEPACRRIREPYLGYRIHSLSRNARHPNPRALATDE
jgi:hypothetical protein